MKTSNYSAIILTVIFVCFTVVSTTLAQGDEPAKSPRATVSQTVGVDTKVVIDYGRPAMRGRDIYWDVVPNGMEEPNNYSDNKPFPWRAGANQNTTIEFNIPQTSEVSLNIYNILGEEVATLVSDRLSAGSYSYEWDASNLVSGVYLYRLQAGDHIQTRKMVLMR